MRFKQFFESLWGGDLKYNLPKDKEQQLYDFYMYTLLLKTGDKQADYVVNEIGDILLPQLKQNLLDAVLFAICAEIRHINSEHATSIIPVVELIAKKMGSSYAIIYQNYIRNLNSKLSIPNTQEENFEPKLDYRNRQIGKSEDYQNSYRAMIKSTKDPKDFILIAKFLFTGNGVYWDNEYGGESWGRICDSWLKLYKAESKSEMMIWIDHVYDLQHNTDTVFNKLKTYYKKTDVGSGYSWLKQALDFKASIKDPHNLYPLISNQLKPLAARLLKIKYNKTVNETSDLKGFLCNKYDDAEFFNYYNNLYSTTIFLVFEIIDNWVKKNNYSDILNNFKIYFNEKNYEKGSLLDAINYFTYRDNMLIVPKMEANTAGFNLSRENNTLILKNYVYAEGLLPKWFNKGLSIIKPLNFKLISDAMKTKNKDIICKAILDQIGVVRFQDRQNIMIFCDYLANLD